MAFTTVLVAALAGQTAVPPPLNAAWQPTAPYVIIGQDEPGYRNWYIAAPWHARGVRAFHEYLAAAGVAGVVPTWQLLRTASDWMKCGNPAFEIAPTGEWPNIVQTLRYVRDVVIPAVGPVEPVSVYRNPSLNTCAGGAEESAHRYLQAVDLVPLRPTTREAMMATLCSAHTVAGERYAVGLGFYPFLRFHIDSRKYRRWGYADAPPASACMSDPIEITDAAHSPAPATAVSRPSNRR